MRAGLQIAGKYRTRATLRARRVGVSLSLAGVALAAAACSSGPSTATQVKTLLSAGIAAVNAKDYSAAIADFNQVLQKAPTDKTDDQFAYYNRGLAEQLTGQTSSAEDDYRSSLALNPNYVPALYNLAIVVTSSAPQEAEDLYLQVIAIQPNYSSAHLNLGFVYQTLSQRASAIQQFALAVHYTPGFATNVPASYRAAVNRAVTALATKGATGTTGTTATTVPVATGASGPT